jgi:clan AA aspartic protease
MSVKLKPDVVVPVETFEKPKRVTTMGEVRVDVKLINLIDEGLVRRGLLAPDKVRTYTADALVDTGAVRTALPVHIVQQLGLAIIGKSRAEYVNGAVETVDVTEAVGFEINGRRAAKETLVLGNEVLIGQTILEEMDLLVDCVNQRVIGNPAHPDQPVFKVK